MEWTEHENSESEDAGWELVMDGCVDDLEDVCKIGDLLLVEDASIHRGKKKEEQGMLGSETQRDCSEVWQVGSMTTKYS